VTGKRSEGVQPRIIRFRANLELAGWFLSLIRRFEDFGGIFKVKPLY